MSQPSTTPVAFGSHGQRAVLVLIGAVFVLLGGGVLASDHSVPGIAIGAFVVGVGAVAVGRGPIVGVRVDTRGVTHRTLTRTTVIAWCCIRDIAAGSGGGSSPLPTGAPVLTLDDGRTRVLIGMASSTATRRGQSAVEQHRQTLLTQHALHRAACATC
ncbi:hypothetical protein AB0M28_00230 [Streptomyces sp. NPDC051940]|uniref:hypothetical protein n=1 Tax=Streptomyces sp. NPDC051940 TaxID=3155675 RepID=UPI003424A53A